MFFIKRREPFDIDGWEDELHDAFPRISWNKHEWLSGKIRCFDFTQNIGTEKIPVTIHMNESSGIGVWICKKCIAEQGCDIEDVVDIINEHFGVI